MRGQLTTTEPEPAPRKSPFEINEPEKVSLRNLRLGENLPEIESLSLEKRGEGRAIADNMAASYRRKVQYIKKIALSLSETDPYLKELTPEGIDAKAREGVLEFVLQRQATEITWGDLQEALERSPDESAILWATIKKMTREDLAGGQYAAQAVQADRAPSKRAQFAVMLDAFSRGWQPRDAIEQALVETLVQAHISFNYWLGAATAATEYSGYAAESIESQSKMDDRWNPPRLTSQQTIDNAMAMADRFNRLFMRTLRQMRDLRRYSLPVTIHNPTQVNINDGGQQVNAVR